MNEQLEIFENQLEEMPFNKRIAIYVGIVTLLVYMSWNLFGEDMSQEITTKEASIHSLEDKLEKSSIRSYERSIKNTEKKILLLDEELNELHFKKQFVRTKLESIAFIFSNGMGFAKILDTILKESIEKNLTINSLESLQQKAKSRKHIKLKEIFSIKGNGAFKNIMSLMQKIDSMNAILTLSHVKVFIDDTNSTAFDLNVSHYGVEL